MNNNPFKTFCVSFFTDFFKSDRHPAVFISQDTGSLKLKMGSIEFCKLGFAFKGDLSGGQVPL